MLRNFAGKPSSFATIKANAIPTAPLKPPYVKTITFEKIKIFYNESLKKPQSSLIHKKLETK